MVIMLGVSWFLLLKRGMAGEGQHLWNSVDVKESLSMPLRNEPMIDRCTGEKRLTVIDVAGLRRIITQVTLLTLAMEEEYTHPLTEGKERGEGQMLRSKWLLETMHRPGRDMHL